MVVDELVFLVQVADQLFSPIVVFKLQTDCSVIAEDYSFDDLIDLDGSLADQPDV